ncbi:MAG: hypothetical protein F6K22_21050 [Okeania sp. SIO2F4]|uniref:hypothetical protein n=1 Tax=Okeania sp. SIO2F4 TaxID=2607790 RepID=UPI00142CE2BF|nr:hypothetical protein [Okeania sp. SIO2F4]NES05092.1 hypothetical protein [Okeania sp. SIO2F4]
MAGSKKLASWKIKRYKNNCDRRFSFKSLESENSCQNQTITTNKNMNKLQSDWSGYCDELDPY